ncbi:hypothetical protein KKF91_01525 [Myxococcota bacterium]|nr:hypothetical protein [Myxococcota bacterium]
MKHQSSEREGGIIHQARRTAAAAFGRRHAGGQRLMRRHRRAPTPPQALTPPQAALRAPLRLILSHAKPAPEALGPSGVRAWRAPSPAWGRRAQRRVTTP